MQDSATEGVVIVRVGDESIPMRFTWRSIDQLATRWGDDWQARIELTLSTMDIHELAFMLSVSTGRDEDFWLDASLPIVPTIARVQKAITWSFFGAEGPKAADPQTARKSNRENWWRRLFGHGWLGAEMRSPSGL